MGLPPGLGTPGRWRRATARRSPRISLRRGDENMRYENDPEGLRLPIKLDTTTNGEFAPIPLEPVHHLAHDLAREGASLNARRLGLDRRSFMVSACGVASTLLGMNAAYARSGMTGGFYEVPRE